MNGQRVLCVCAAGLVRSVALKDAVFFGWNNVDVLNCGVEHNKPETLAMLFTWADVILIVDDKLMPQIPEKFRSKTKIVPIGDDVWGSPDNLELRQKVQIELIKLQM